jgi:tight adherence protein C
VLRGLGRRAGGDVAALAQLLDRSRRLGSPLAAGLQEQAVGLRERQAREIEERAARAAPKIQLIVALLLVPSVLLLVAAAILANAEALLGGL